MLHSYISFTHLNLNESQEILQKINIYFLLTYDTVDFKEYEI